MKRIHYFKSLYRAFIIAPTLSKTSQTLASYMKAAAVTIWFSESTQASYQTTVSQGKGSSRKRPLSYI